ncbi:TetR family transcriptional regulator [Jiangella asiatica]|uniref:TetR family transcriptional regulator n=1 Tax=Jiangella asiatica TaxID=2530372 RepID=A0A4R5DPW8_9ACTN|nr:TetR family transcriptional regulator [Jiangella asiatica]TDE14091.1 TetR family transcriptional regulator [Jiangella asiatica]
MSDSVGLRERKKAATRAALSAAANRLAIEHGVDHVTVEAIAAAADVSPRTFHNYFSSREEAIVAGVVDWANALTDKLRDRPADEPIWDALLAVLLDSVDDRPEAKARWKAQSEMIMANPSVVASQLAALDGMRRRVAEVVAERTGTDPDRDLYPRLTGGSAAQALKAALDLWISGKTDRGIKELIVEAFELLRAGLPEPSQSR